MNIERLTNSKYIVFFNFDETGKLKAIARTFYHGNKAAALSEVISEGINLSLVIKDLHKPESDTEAITKRFCEIQLERRDRLRKVQKDDSKSTDE